MDCDAVTAVEDIDMNKLAGGCHIVSSHGIVQQQKEPHNHRPNPHKHRLQPERAPP